MTNIYKSKNPISFLRVFTISSLISVVVILFFFSFSIHKIFVKHNINDAEQYAIGISQAIFEHERDVFLGSDSEKEITLNVAPEDFPKLDKHMKNYLHLLNIVKIKVFSTDRKIVYSTDHSIIGQIDAHNEKLNRALKGEVVSKLEKKDELWDLAEEKRYDIDLVETYLPVRDKNNKIVGSFEIYLDISRYQKEIEGFLKSFIIIGAVILVLVFGFLFVQMRQGTNQLSKNEEKLRESEEKFRLLFENAVDAVFWADSKTGLIIKCNKAAETLLEKEREEIIGRHQTMLHPPQKSEYYAEIFRKHLADKGAVNIEAEVITKTGKIKPVSITASITSVGEKQIIQGIFCDITERKRAEEMIQLQLKRINALHLIEKAITASLDLKVTLDILLDQVTTQLKIDAATVLLLNPQTKLLQYINSKGFRTSALKYTQLKLGESNAGRAAIERQVITIANLKENLDGFERSKPFKDEDFITYFAVPLIAKGEVKGILELFNRVPLNPEPEWLEFVETIADQAAIAIDNATLFEGLQRSNVELTLAYDTTIEGWSRAMDMRDKETEGHTQRVTEMTLRIAQEMGIKEEEFVHIRRGALLHDMGKLGVPDNILLKPGPLTDEEWGIMKRHPQLAYEMLYPIEYLRPALDIPYCHHEKWDGTGYPKGLKGEEIPLAARIFAVVDVWDALNSDRPYRPAWTREKVREHICSLSGTHFEPNVAEVFLKMEW